MYLTYMSTLRQTIETYTELISSAWHKTISQPNVLFVSFLIVFAFPGMLFAQLINFASNISLFATSGIQNIALFHPLSWLTLSLSSTGDGVNLLGITIAITLSIILFLIGVFCEQILITAIRDNSHESLRFKKIWKLRDNVHFKDLLYVNIIGVFVQILLFAIGGIILNAFLTIGGITGTLASIALYTTLLPIYFFWQALIFQAIIRTSTHRTHALEALKLSIEDVQKHSLTMLELAIGIFFVQALLAVTMVAFAVFVTVITLPMVALFASIFGSIGFYMFGALLFTAVVLLSLFYISVSISFSYHAWFEYAKSVREFGIIGAIDHLLMGLKKIIYKK